MKKSLPMICNIVSGGLVVAFAVKSIVDYSQYSSTFNSAPFSTWVLLNALYFLVPAALVFGVGTMVKKKQ